MIKICSINFWESAFNQDFLHYLVQESTNHEAVYVESVDDADIIFSSVFGRKKSPKSKTIFYIGENIRPNFHRCRYALSFDIDDFNGKNFYLPYWYSRLDWPGYSYENIRENNPACHGFEELIPLNALTEKRKLAFDKQKKKFCCLIASNPEGLRTNLFMALQSYKPIDGYGIMFNNPLKTSKFSVLNNYNFCLCPENSLYPGYVTEKLFDAWHGGCIPIWYGPSDPPSFINKKAFINYGETYDVIELVKTITNLDSNLDSYKQIFEQPLLLSPPSIEPAIQFTANAINQILTSP